MAEHEVTPATDEQIAEWAAGAERGRVLSPAETRTLIARTLRAERQRSHASHVIDVMYPVVQAAVDYEGWHSDDERDSMACRLICPAVKKYLAAARDLKQKAVR